MFCANWAVYSTISSSVPRPIFLLIKRPSVILETTWPGDKATGFCL